MRSKLLLATAFLLASAWATKREASGLYNDARREGPGISRRPHYHGSATHTLNRLDRDGDPWEKYYYGKLVGIRNPKPVGRRLPSTRPSPSSPPQKDVEELSYEELWGMRREFNRLVEEKDRIMNKPSPPDRSMPDMSGWRTPSGGDDQYAREVEQRLDRLGKAFEKEFPSKEPVPGFSSGYLNTPKLVSPEKQDKPQRKSSNFSRIAPPLVYDDIMPVATSGVNSVDDPVAPPAPSRDSFSTRRHESTSHRSPRRHTPRESSLNEADDFGLGSLMDDLASKHDEMYKSEEPAPSPPAVVPSPAPAEVVPSPVNEDINRLRGVESALRDQIRNLQGSRGAKSWELALLKRQLAEARNSLTQRGDSNSSLQQQIQSLHQRIQDLGNEKEDLETALQEAENKANELEQELSRQRLAEARKNTELETVQLNSRFSEEQVSSLQQQLEALRQALNEANSEKENLSMHRNEIGNELTLLTQQLEDKQNRIYELENEVAELHQRLIDQASAVDTQRTGRIANQWQSLAHRAQKNNLEKALAEKNAELSALNNQYADLQGLYDQATLRIQQLEEQVNDLLCSKECLEVQLQELQEENQQLLQQQEENEATIAVLETEKQSLYNGWDESQKQWEAWGQEKEARIAELENQLEENEQNFQDELYNTLDKLNEANAGSAEMKRLHEEQLAAIQEEKDALACELECLNAEIDGLKQENEALTTEKEQAYSNWQDAHDQWEEYANALKAQITSLEEQQRLTPDELERVLRAMEVLRYVEELYREKGGFDDELPVAPEATGG